MKCSLGISNFLEEISAAAAVAAAAAAAAAAKLLQSCPTLCDPIDGSIPDSTFPEILQARILEWVAISFSSAWKWKVKVKSLSRVRLFATPWTAAHQAPPSMGFSRQEYWSGVPLPSPKRSLVFPILLFSSISLHWSLRKAFLSLLAILWNYGFNGYIYAFYCFPNLPEFKEILNEAILWVFSELQRRR